MVNTISALMVAQLAIEKEKLTREFVEQYAFGYGDDEENLLWPRVMSVVTRMSPAVLGDIVATGKSFDEGGDAGLPKALKGLYSVHCGSYLGKYKSGLELLQTLATTALICWIHLLLTETKTDE